MLRYENVRANETKIAKTPVCGGNGRSSYRKGGSGAKGIIKTATAKAAAVQKKQPKLLPQRVRRAVREGCGDGLSRSSHP